MHHRQRGCTGGLQDRRRVPASHHRAGEEQHDWQDCPVRLGLGQRDGLVRRHRALAQSVGLSATDLKKTPTANFAVKDTSKMTDNAINSNVACELSARTHGPRNGGSSWRKRRRLQRALRLARRRGRGMRSELGPIAAAVCVHVPMVSQ